MSKKIIFWFIVFIIVTAGLYYLMGETGIGVSILGLGIGGHKLSWTPGLDKQAKELKDDISDIDKEIEDVKDGVDDLTPKEEADYWKNQ